MKDSITSIKNHPVYSTLHVERHSVMIYFFFEIPISYKYTARKPEINMNDIEERTL